MLQAASATIVVLNYNYARFLRRSLDSALGQTWPQVQVVVVDDCSTDESREVIASYGGRLSAVLQARNSGHGAGMNAGFAAATGEVVSFLDADDFLRPNAVERVMRGRRPDAAQYQYRLDLVDADGRPFDSYPPREMAWEDGDVIPALLRKGRYSTTVTSGLAFERRALEAALPMDPEAFRQGGDGYLVTVAPFYGRVVTLDETLGAYRQHGVNHSQSAIGARASWRIWHDERRYEALRQHAERRGLEARGELWRNDPVSLEERAAAHLLAEDAEPAPGARRLLARCAIGATRNLPVSSKRRMMLAGWWLVVGYAPTPAARAVLSWKLQASTRPAVVRRLARLARRMGGRPAPAPAGKPDVRRPESLVRGGTPAPAAPFGLVPDGERSAMKAVRIHRFGGPEVLQLEELPTPDPAAGEILVRVRASSVNPVDYKMRNGGYLEWDQLPVVLGRDIAGSVGSCGPEAGAFKPGDAVYAMLPPGKGGHAEFVTVPAEACARKPERLDFVQAAAVPLAALTAWQGLFTHGELKAGQSVLIHGASGGVGHFAVQFAVARGATVIATCAGADRDYVRSLGAAKVVDYKAEDFRDAAQNVDLVFDLVGGEAQDRSWTVLREGGVLVSTLGAPDQDKAAAVKARGATYVAEASGAQLAEIARLIDEGRVTPHVDRVFPLEDSAEAERALEEEHVRGKVVLEVA